MVSFLRTLNAAHSAETPAIPAKATMSQRLISVVGGPALQDKGNGTRGHGRREGVGSVSAASAGGGSRGARVRQTYPPPLPSSFRSGQRWLNLTRREQWGGGEGEGWRGVRVLTFRGQPGSICRSGVGRRRRASGRSSHRERQWKRRRKRRWLRERRNRGEGRLGRSAISQKLHRSVDESDCSCFPKTHTL